MISGRIAELTTRPISPRQPWVWSSEAEQHWPELAAIILEVADLYENHTQSD